MELYRTIKHENRVNRVNRDERQNRGASSHKERIAEYVPTYAFTPLFLNIDIL